MGFILERRESSSSHPALCHSLLVLTKRRVHPPKEKAQGLVFFLIWCAKIGRE